MDAITENRPRPPRGGSPDSEMPARLLWLNHWMPADRFIRPLTALTTEHLWGVAGYLRWYADEMLLLDRAAGDDMSVERYLRSRPVWQGISCELLRRGELRIDLLDALRDQGPVAWETPAP